MTHRNLTTSAAALLAIGVTAWTPLANAAETALLAAPGSAVQQDVLIKTSAGPTAAELKRLKNELRFEARGNLAAALNEAFESALTDTIVVSD
ncbi:MAG: hypothetical protein AAFU65_03105 [Pseudomonadota bacterium]